MLKPSVAFFFGASLLSGMLMAQSSQPPQTPSTPQQPSASPVQPAPNQQPPSAIPVTPAQTESAESPKKPLMFRRIIIKNVDVPYKKQKELPIGILDGGMSV